MDIPQWVKDFIAGTIEVTPEIVAAFRQWSAMQNPVTLFSSIGTNFLSQNLARQDFETMYGSLPPEARYEAAQAEQSRIADLMMNPNLPQASRDAFEQQFIAAGEETTYAAINLGIYNGTIDGTDRQSVNNALFEENSFYFGDYDDYGFNSPEEYFQAVIDDPFTNPPPEDVAWLFDTYKDADGNEILVYDHVVAAAKDYDEKQAEAQAQYALEAENRANMERLYGNLEASGINPDISRGIALGGDKDAIAAQLGMGTFRTSAQQNAGVLTAPQRGYVTYGFTGDGSDGAATSDSYDYSVSTQPDLNVQRDIVPQGYQGPAGSFSVGAGSGNPLFGPNKNVASHGDPNPSRNLTSGNLPMSMAQLSSGVYQSGNRSLAESKLPDMYFDLTDSDQMNSYLGNATYAGIPYDVAINQLIEHNQQYHPERFAQDQQSEDYDPFTLASDFLSTATEDPNSQFNSPAATALAENLGQYTTSVSDIVEETRVAEESIGGVDVTPVETTLESGDTTLESGDTTLVTETADEEETVADIVESTRVAETSTGVLPDSTGDQINLDESTAEINNLLDDSGDDTVPTSTSVSRTINGPPTAEQRALAYRLFAENGDRTMLNDIIAYNTEMAGIAERAAANEEGGIASEQAGLNASLDDERNIVRAAFEQRGHRATDEEIDQILDENPNFVNQDGVVSSNSIETSLSGAVNQYVKDFRSPYTDFVRDQLTNLGYEASDKEIKRIIADSRWVGFGNSVDSNALERGLSTEISSFAADKGVGGKNQEDVDSERAGNEDFSLQDTVAPMWAAQDPESKFTAEPVPRINPAWNGLEEWQAQQNSVVDNTGLNVQPDGEVLPGSNVDGVTNDNSVDNVTTDVVNNLTLEQVKTLLGTDLLSADDVIELIKANPQYTEEDIVEIGEAAGFTTQDEIDALFEAVDTTTDNIAGDVTQLGLDVGDLSGDVTELGLDLGDLSGDLTDVQTEVSGISGIVDELQIDITDVNGRIDLVEITFQGAVDALQEQHDAEIAIINEQLANDIPALQTALDALTIQQQEDVDALTTAYTEAITAAQSETTDEFLGILENYITNENLTDTLSDYVTNEGLAETLDSYVNRIEDGYNQLLEDYGDLQDQVDQASSQYEVDALATQMEQMRDEIDTYVDQTGYDPQTGTVTGGTGGDGTGTGGPYSDNGDGTETGDGTGSTNSGGTPTNGGPYSDNFDDTDPNAGGGTTGSGTPPNGGPTGGGDNFEDTDPNAGGGTTGGPGPGGGGDGGGGEDWDPTLGRTYPGPQPGGGIGSGFLGNQYPPRQYQNQGYDPYTRPGPPGPLTGLTALTQPYNRPRQGEPVNPQYNPTYNYPYPPLNNKGEDDEISYDEYGQPIMGYNQGGQIQPITDMSMNDMLQNQGIGSLTNYETNVAPFQNAFRPNVRRYN